MDYTFLLMLLFLVVLFQAASGWHCTTSGVSGCPGSQWGRLRLAVAGQGSGVDSEAVSGWRI